jgi:hypothetical protein
MVIVLPSVATIAGAQLVDELEFARLLGRRPEKLLEYGKRHSIFSVELAGTRWYPAFFLNGICRPRDLYLVSRRLGGLPGGSKLQFFAQPKASLGGITPLEALRFRSLATVLRAAEGFAER